MKNRGPGRARTERPAAPDSPVSVANATGQSTAAGALNGGPRRRAADAPPDLRCIDHDHPSSLPDQDFVRRRNRATNPNRATGVPVEPLVPGQVRRGRTARSAPALCRYQAILICMPTVPDGPGETVTCLMCGTRVIGALVRSHPAAVRSPWSPRKHPRPGMPKFASSQRRPRTHGGWRKFSVVASLPPNSAVIRRTARAVPVSNSPWTPPVRQSPPVRGWSPAVQPNAQVRSPGGTDRPPTPCRNGVRPRLGSGPIVCPGEVSV